MAAVAVSLAAARAEIPTAEKLLPEDTLVVVTTPDISKLKETYHKSAQTKVLDDPAMKPFRDKLMAKWKGDFLEPLERELDIKVSDYASFFQGQATLALVQNDWDGSNDKPLGMLVMVDAREKSSQLQTNLTSLRKRWVDAGKSLRTESIRNKDFMVLSISSNDLPKTLRKFFPRPLETQELGVEPDHKAGSKKSEVFIGQVESLLIIGNSSRAIEKVVVHLTGGSMPSLAEVAAYQANHQALFRDAPAYGWVNVKAFLSILAKKPIAKSEVDSPEPASPAPDKIMSALGLNALKSAAFTVQNSAEGSMMQFFLSIPESERTGLFKLIGGNTLDTSPPAFVPADAIKFQRIRVDGQKAWAGLQKMLSDISPQAVATLNFVLDTANSNAKDKDAAFDIRKNLIGTLGDDIISYTKKPRGSSVADLKAAPSITLIGSPNPEQFTAALKNVLVFMAQQAGNPAEREFLGRKIYSVPLPNIPLPMSDASKPTGPRTLNYAAASGYVVMSTDNSILEEYLRSSESKAKALKEVAGLAEATQKVGGLGTLIFGYENQAETSRISFDLLKKDPTTANVLGMLPSMMGATGSEMNFKEWFDFSLLPDFDKISKYFNFMVYAGGTTREGLSFKAYSPVPPGLK